MYILKSNHKVSSNISIRPFQIKACAQLYNEFVCFLRNVVREGNQMNKFAHWSYWANKVTLVYATVLYLSTCRLDL